MNSLTPCQRRGGRLYMASSGGCVCKERFQPRKAVLQSRMVCSDLGDCMARGGYIKSLQLNSQYGQGIG
jgi:hypothetical protein